MTTAIAGEGYIAHFKWAGVGLLVGGAISALLHEPLNKGMEAARRGAQGLRDMSAVMAEQGKWLTSKIPAFAGGFGGWVFGRGEKEFVSIRNAIEASETDIAYKKSMLNVIEHKEKGVGHWLADHALFFIPKSYRNTMLEKSNRLETAMIGGGLLGSIGFFFSPALYAGEGYRKGVAGKEQFQRLQDEVLTTRAERDALRDKYVETQIELDTVKAGQQGLKVAKDNPPPIDTVHEDATALLDSPQGPSAPVIGPAPTTGRTLPGEPPRIQEPVIGPEHTEGWADRMSARDAEAAAYHDAIR